MDYDGSSIPKLTSIPAELLYRIEGNLSTRDKLSLAWTCRSLWNAISPRLYRHIEMDTETDFTRFPPDKRTMVRTIRFHRYLRNTPLNSCLCFANCLGLFKNITLLDLTRLEDVCVPFIPFEAWQNLHELRLWVCVFDLGCDVHVHEEEHGTLKYGQPESAVLPALRRVSCSPCMAKRILQVARGVTHLSMQGHVAGEEAGRDCDISSDDFKFNLPYNLLSNITHVGLYGFTTCEPWMEQCCGALRAVACVEWELSGSCDGYNVVRSAIEAIPQPESVVLLWEPENWPKWTDALGKAEVDMESILPSQTSLKKLELRGEMVSAWTFLRTSNGT
ncbi:hypothetical protein ONZ45_g17778 [Pleurotus djamor]|nr:hypothetical protein ONZ45_g17778 [Pleurotus djamor]